jgi:hypothetical protein
VEGKVFDGYQKVEEKKKWLRRTIARANRSPFREELSHRNHRSKIVIDVASGPPLNRFAFHSDRSA